MAGLPTYQLEELCNTAPASAGKIFRFYTSDEHSGDCASRKNASDEKTGLVQERLNTTPRLNSLNGPVAKQPLMP
jgi:hypothetical protein